MKFKSLLHFILLSFCTLNLSAQELTLKLSQHPNKQAFVVAIHGVRKDTIGSVVLDKYGAGTLAYKDKQLLSGLVNLTIKDKDLLSFDFVLSPDENPILVCEEEYVHALNTKILKSPENDCINRWFDAVVQYKQKIALNQELGKLYPSETTFSKQLAIELLNSSNQLEKLRDTIDHSKLFAAKYMQFKIDQEEKLAKVWEGNEERAKGKKYFTQIDFEALYGSSMWFPIINSCIEAYMNESPYHGTFGQDVVDHLKRIKNQKVYEDLIDAAVSVTEKFSWNTDQEVIVAFIISDNRIKNPDGKLQKIVKSFSLSIGKKAPDLVLTNSVGKKTTTTILNSANLDSKFTLLLFYQSDCGHCETAIAALKSNYQELANKGVKIISIAGDLDQATFTNTAASFPWTAKYCDEEGMNGVNFTNYAVIGTPTMYLLNSKGIIIQKPATVDELVLAP